MIVGDSMLYRCWVLRSCFSHQSSCSDQLAQLGKMGPVRSSALLIALLAWHCSSSASWVAASPSQGRSFLPSSLAGTAFASFVVHTPARTRIVRREEETCPIVSNRWISLTKKKKYGIALLSHWMKGTDGDDEQEKPSIDADDSEDADDAEKNQVLLTEEEVSKRVFDRLMLPDRIGSFLNGAAWTFVAVGFLLQVFGYAYVRDDDGLIRIGTLEEQQFKREVMNSMKEKQQIAAPDSKQTIDEPIKTR